MALITFTSPMHKDKTVYAVAGSHTQTILREVAALLELGHVTKAEIDQMYVDDIPPTQWRLACQMIVRDEDILVEYPSK